MFVFLGLLGIRVLLAEKVKRGRSWGPTFSLRLMLMKCLLDVLSEYVKVFLSFGGSEGGEFMKDCRLSRCEQFRSWGARGERALSVVKRMDCLCIIGDYLLIKFIIQ